MWRVAVRPVPPRASRLGFCTRWNSWSCHETPNPNVRKFEAAGPAPSLSVSPLFRDRLLSLDGVRDVFVAQSGGASMDAAVAPWVSVTRADGESWEALAPRVQAVLSELPENGSDAAVDAIDAASSSAGATALTGTEAEIDEVLTHRVRPSVQADGGDVELLRWDAASGEVVLTLKGACRGCPQSAVTLQESIFKTLQHFVPEVRSVVSEEEELSPTDDPYADIPWAHDGDAEPDAIIQAAAAGTPFFSIFAGTRMEGAKLRRVRFMSRLELQGRKPAHIFISCVSCKARRSVEDPQDLLRKDKGNTTNNAAVVICPTCCVLISP